MNLFCLTFYYIMYNYLPQCKQEVGTIKRSFVIQLKIYTLPKRKDIKLKSHRTQYVCVCIIVLQNLYVS